MKQQLYTTFAALRSSAAATYAMVQAWPLWVRVYDLAILAALIFTIGGKL
ncbi:hypothetical protein [Acidithiobacillus sulfuriphilus]